MNGWSGINWSQAGPAFLCNRVVLCFFFFSSCFWIFKRTLLRCSAKSSPQVKRETFGCTSSKSLLFLIKSVLTVLYKLVWIGWLLCVMRWCSGSLRLLLGLISAVSSPFSALSPKEARLKKEAWSQNCTFFCLFSHCRMKLISANSYFHPPKSRSPFLR